MHLDACFLKGWRTLTACAAFVVTGLLSVVGELDLTPVVALAVKNPEYVGVAMVGVGALFGFLRYLSNTGIGVKHPEPDSDYARLAGVERMRPGIDEGN